MRQIYNSYSIFIIPDYCVLMGIRLSFLIANKKICHWIKKSYSRDDTREIRSEIKKVNTKLHHRIAVNVKYSQKPVFYLQNSLSNFFSCFIIGYFFSVTWLVKCSATCNFIGSSKKCDLKLKILRFVIESHCWEQIHTLKVVTFPHRF